VLPGYELSDGIFDEAFEPDGRPRRHYAGLLERLTEESLPELGSRLKRGLREDGVTFGDSPDGIFALDLVPRVLPAGEWRHVEKGIVQRARALRRFVADVYGEREIVSAGVIPQRAIESSVQLERAMVRAAPPRSWITMIGFDLVRSPDGQLRVLEDNITMPSGIAYVVAAREALSALEPFALFSPAPVAEAFQRLRRALRAAAPPAAHDPVIAVLSEGPDAAGWYEHARIARELSIPTVTLDALSRRNGRVIARLESGVEQVDVLLQRTEQARFTDRRGHRTALGELLLDPICEGGISCVNAPGAGIADDKLMHAYVERMIRFYLGEEPILPSVVSYDLGDAGERERCLQELEDLVIKPRSGMGGEGVVVWSQATEREREERLAALEKSPHELVAQRRVELSCHPTLSDGRLRPRRVDLRPYVILSPEGEWALPGGLTRVALERGSLIVNSGQGGGAKDSWVTA
jgi:uncharacterized circularly permuted ATP-grasp superfamily protein